MHMEEVQVGLGSASKSAEMAQPKTSVNMSKASIGRRTFMKRLGLSGTALLPASSILAGRRVARASGLSGGLSRGDVAILRFLAAAELLESDLWQQYNELALGNESYQLALNVLDGDEATYVNLNTRDEFTHANFINKYLEAKGHKPVSFDQFKILPSSQATGANKGAKRLTNLMQLTVDTSFYFRYRSALNPDFGVTFPQIVDLVNVPGIPNADLPPPTDPNNGFMIQFIANTAGFHFASIEQGGSSLYQSFLPKVISPEVLRIVGAIGGTEIQHYQTWTDKAGNAPMLMDNQGNTIFPQLPLAPDLPNPPDGTDNADPNDTNQIFATPCEFIDPSLPLCSVIRPISTEQAGAKATVEFFKKDGLFIGQSQAFLDFLNELAEEADAAQRESD
jgi:Ferritin-like domain